VQTGLDLIKRTSELEAANGTINTVEGELRTAKENAKTAANDLVAVKEELRTVKGNAETANTNLLAEKEKVNVANRDTLAEKDKVNAANHDLLEEKHKVNVASGQVQAAQKEVNSMKQELQAVKIQLADQRLSAVLVNKHSDMQIRGLQRRLDVTNIQKQILQLHLDKASKSMEVSVREFESRLQTMTAKFEQRIKYSAAPIQVKYDALFLEKTGLEKQLADGIEAKRDLERRLAEATSDLADERQKYINGLAEEGLKHTNDLAEKVVLATRPLVEEAIRSSAERGSLRLQSGNLNELAMSLQCELNRAKKELELVNNGVSESQSLKQRIEQEKEAAVKQCANLEVTIASIRAPELSESNTKRRRVDPTTPEGAMANEYNLLIQEQRRSLQSLIPMSNTNIQILFQEISPMFGGDSGRENFNRYKSQHKKMRLQWRCLRTIMMSGYKHANKDTIEEGLQCTHCAKAKGRNDCYWCPQVRLEEETTWIRLVAKAPSKSCF
jgi:hypothetical protein